MLTKLWYIDQRFRKITDFKSNLHLSMQEKVPNLTIFTEYSGTTSCGSEIYGISEDLTNKY